jgi:hypothetical protein
MEIYPLQYGQICLQKRDIVVLCAFFESRIMTIEQAGAIFFQGKREYAKKRLQKIRAAGLLGLRRRSIVEPAVYFLTPIGYSFLLSHRLLSEYPRLSAGAFSSRSNVSELTLRHELEVMDVKAAFHAALHNMDGFTVDEFITWPLLIQFEVMRTELNLVKPDGFFRLKITDPPDNFTLHNFFLEVDRSTESLEILAERVISYQIFFRTGGFASRCGKSPSQFRECPFRILLVFKTAERRNNFAERLLQNEPPIRTQAYLTTIEEVRTDPFGAIWIHPLDYRLATNSTPFASAKRNRFKTYKHQCERDKLVEGTIHKRSILATGNGY